MFIRRSTDAREVCIPLENQFAGSQPTPCWIIGGGPSLSRLAIDQILASPAPRFGVNLAGTGLLRPHFWTSYDPTARFHRSIYLDPSVTKFVHSSRAMDLVPETTFKVCDCPALYLIDRDPQRGFQDFPGQGESPITDWQDSLIQAIDIAYRLGFRELFLAGCEMFIQPSRPLRQAAAAKGVHYAQRELLGDFVKRCEQAGISRIQMEELATASQYHFEENKTLAAAIQTDFHYFRVAQTLRLCRRSLALAGLKIHSVTPRSRLNDDFPFLSVTRASGVIRKLNGDPAAEETRGRYSESKSRRPDNLGPMRDFRPHFWSTDQKPQPRQPARSKSVSSKPSVVPVRVDPLKKLRQAIRDLPEVPVDIEEQG